MKKRKRLVSWIVVISIICIALSNGWLRRKPAPSAKRKRRSSLNNRLANCVFSSGIHVHKTSISVKGKNKNEGIPALTKPSISTPENGWVQSVSLLSWFSTLV